MSEISHSSTDASMSSISDTSRTTSEDWIDVEFAEHKILQAAQLAYSGDGKRDTSTIFEIFISLDANATPRCYSVHLCCAKRNAVKEPQMDEPDTQKDVLGRPEILNTTQSAQLSQAYLEMFVLVSALLKENESDSLKPKPSDE